LFEHAIGWSVDRDVVPDEIVERGKLQLWDVGGAHEEDPSLLLQRLVRKIADPLSLAGAQRGEHSVPVASVNHPPTTIPGETLERGVLAHGSEDLPENFDAKPRRFVIV
jgi:hypothetical protein